MKMESEYKGRKIIIYRLCDGSEVRADGKTSLHIRDELTGLLTNVSGDIPEGTPVVFADPATNSVIERLVEGSYLVTEPLECTDIRNE